MKKIEREILEFSLYDIRPILNDSALDMYYDEYMEEDESDFKPGAWDDFVHIDEIETYCSLEDSYYEMDVIVKRISDGKFFRGHYTYWQDLENEYELTLEEVFPKEKTITVYE